MPSSIGQVALLALAAAVGTSNGQATVNNQFRILGNTYVANLAYVIQLNAEVQWCICPANVLVDRKQSCSHVCDPFQPVPCCADSSPAIVTKPKGMAID